MKNLAKSLFCLWPLAAGQTLAHGPKPMPLVNAPIPPVPGLLDGADPIVVNKAAAITLGKALFWDVNVGSDGMACASCHFHAGADRRVKNQLNPGEKATTATGASFQPLPSGGGGANYTLRAGDFPTFQFNNPLNQLSGIKFSTDDVISSSGTFSGAFSDTSRFAGSSDACARSADPVFHVNGTGTRRVEPRNAPTVINAIFNHRNFWDGRANNIFNGSSPWGERDPNAGVWVKTNARTVSKQRLHLINSSLASLSTAPPLSDSEMACRQRRWPDIGRKLLFRQPLQSQKVHHTDSVLGSLSLSTPGSLKNGLNTTYQNLITQAFSAKYWSYAATGPFGAPAGKAPYTQMEANFAMFFGIALQLYQGTLISDQAPIDLTQRDPITKEPTWGGLGYTPQQISTLNLGLATFVNNHCNLCHGGPTMTVEAIALNSALVTPTLGKTYGPAYAQIPYGPDALGSGRAAHAASINTVDKISLVSRQDTDGGPKLTDFGFANTGVGDPNNDPGINNVDDFGNPLSFANQYVSYLRGQTSRILDPGVSKTRSCDFKALLAFNLNFPSTTEFTAVDGLEVDGNREGAPRTQNCLNDTFGLGNATSTFIPTVAAANAAATSAPAKLAVATKAVFKIPGLRNIELTGPYMHNGSMATLEQVLEFYSRHGNVANDNRHNLVTAIGMGNDPTARAALVALLKAFTDERVRFERAPFDHPEIKIPNGHPGNPQSVTAGNTLESSLATDDFLVVPAVGASGATQPLRAFETFLAP